MNAHGFLRIFLQITFISVACLTSLSRTSAKSSSSPTDASPGKPSVRIPAIFMLLADLLGLISLETGTEIDWTKCSRSCRRLVPGDSFSSSDDAMPKHLKGVKL